MNGVKALAEIKLFSLNEGVKECTSSEVVLEKELQTLIEQNMEVFFGVRFLKSEYALQMGVWAVLELMKTTVLSYLNINAVRMRM